MCHDSAGQAKQDHSPSAKGCGYLSHVVAACFLCCYYFHVVKFEVASGIESAAPLLTGADHPVAAISIFCICSI